MIAKKIPVLSYNKPALHPDDKYVVVYKNSETDTFRVIYYYSDNNKANYNVTLFNNHVSETNKARIFAVYHRDEIDMIPEEATT